MAIRLEIIRCEHIDEHGDRSEMAVRLGYAKELHLCSLCADALRFEVLQDFAERIARGAFANELRRVLRSVR